MTPAQLATFRTAILAQTATIPAGQPWSGAFVGMAVKDIPNSGDGNAATAGWYNLAANPAYLAWRTDAPRSLFRQLVVLSNYTPSDAVPTGPSTDLTYSNRAFLAQLKQANLMFVCTGDGTLDASDATLRQTLQDCMRGIPTGAGGSNNDAGWGTGGNPNPARLSLMRSITNAEKLFSVQGAGTGNQGGDARGANTNPDVLVFQGAVSASDVNSALNL